MADLERIEEKPDKVSEFQKKYNINQKNVASILGKNLTLFICMLVPLLLIGFAWTDFGAIIISTKMLSDGAITVMLFTVGEIMMARLGADGGKLDEEYIDAKKVFDGLISEVEKKGTALMGVFCEWQIDVEMEQTVHFRLRMLRMSLKEWEEVKVKTPAELSKRYGKRKAKKILDTINLKPIELNESILLYNGEYATRGGVPMSGEAYLRSKKNLIEMIIACVFTGLLTFAVVVTLTSDITIARVIFTVYKLTMLLFRMARGYDRGARAYNTIEVRQYKAKSNYLRQYIKFIEDKIYLKLEDKYGDISCFVGDTPTYTELTPTYTELTPTTNEE